MAKTNENMYLLSNKQSNIQGIKKQCCQQEAHTDYDKAHKSFDHAMGSIHITNNELIWETP